MILINSNFHRAVETKQSQPFQWGVNDCALFVADIYLEVTGKDFAEGIRGTYDTEYYGMRTIVELGGWDEILTERGFSKLSHKNMLTRGDVVVYQNALGIWLGRYAIFAGGSHRPFEDVEDAYTYDGGAQCLK